MNKLRTIVVGLDFSLCSLKALGHAVRIARWNGARLHVVHVIDALVVIDLAEVLRIPLDEVRTQASRTAEHELERQVLEAGGEATVRVAIGSPIEEILKVVREVSADLLVVGAHGDSAPDLGAGTLAIQCLRKAPTKVLLVDNEAGAAFRTIVACVDFSPTSRHAVEQAQRVASREDGEIHCLHVYDPPWNRLHYLVPTSEPEPNFRRQYLATLQRRLEEFAGSPPPSKIRCALFPHPRMGIGIVEYARQAGADLLIVGARGRTNVRSALTGTTTERLMRELRCSVLIVRPLESSSTHPISPPAGTLP